MANLGRSDKCCSSDRESTSSMVILTEVVSVRRRKEGEGKSQGLFYSVECCRESQVMRAKRFRCGDRGFEDPEARYKALRFGFLAEGLLEFRRFLFGEGLEKSASCFVVARKGPGSGLSFAAVILSSGNGDVHGVSFIGEEEDAAINRAVVFVKGAEFWNWVQRRFCGRQVQGSSEEKENAQKQISEDCLCASCKKVESLEIIIIRMDEQGEYRTVPAEEIGTDNKIVEVTGRDGICTFCGCEDNEGFDKMISICSCNGGSVVAHPNCIHALQAVFRTGDGQPPNLCKVCGRGAVAIGVDLKIEEGSSKLVDLNSSLGEDTMNITPQKGFKQSLSGLSNGGTGNSELMEKQHPSKRFKGEIGRIDVEDPVKEDLPTSEPEKPGVTRPVVSVPIKKRKFRLPSPPSISPKASSSLDSSYPEPAVSLNHSFRLPGAEENQVSLTAHRHQQQPEENNVRGVFFREKSVKKVCETSNDITGKVPSLVTSFSPDIVSNAVDMSRLSTSTMDTSVGKARVGILDLEDANPVSVILKDSEIASGENLHDDHAYEDIHKKECLEKQVFMQENDLLPVSETKSYITAGTSVFNSVSEKEDNNACKEMKEVTKLALGCNSHSESSSHSETVGCSKVTSEAGECSQRKSGSLLKDVEKKEKGLLLRLNSGYFNDDRSHWDLNAPMDSWEKQPEAVNRDSETEFTGKLSAGVASVRDTEPLDGIQLHILVSEAKHSGSKPEQDMLSRGLQADQDGHALNSSVGMAFDKDPVLNTSLTLQSDAKLTHLSPAAQNNSKGGFVSKSFSLSDTLGNEKDLNLSMVHSEAPFEVADSISSPEVHDCRYPGVDHPVAILEKESLTDGGKQDTVMIDVNEDTVNGCKYSSFLQSDKQEDTTMINVNVDTFDGTRDSFSLKHDPEPVEESLDESNLTNTKGNSRCIETSDENAEYEQTCVPSLLSEKQDLNETVKDVRNVDDIHTSATCGGDTNEDNIDIPEEKLESPEAGLDKSSTDYAKEVAYGGDYESGYEDEDEPVSDAEKEFVELAEDEQQNEEGECRETELHDWIEDDVGEELEDEHVDYGDSDFRDADDTGIEQDDKGKDMEHERNLDDGPKSEREENYYIKGAQDMTIRADGEGTQPEMTVAATSTEYSTDREKLRSEGILSDPPEESRGRKGLEMQPNCHLDNNMDLSRSREVRLAASSRQKSSGWDQLPEGYQNAEDALKAVQKEIISKRGRGSSWTTGGRLGGPISGRISSSRIDSGFRERMISDDSIHGKDGFFMRARDGSLSTSPSFASRKPTRGRIVGRGGPSRGIHHRSRGDPWADGASSHWASGRHHSPDYYGSKVGYGSHGSANAAAMSAAKVESSGFVVASDGTLTKITRGVGIRGRRGRGTLMGRGSVMDIEETLDFERQMNMGPGSIIPDTGLNASRGRTILGSDRIDASAHGSRERYRGPSYGHSRWDHPIGDSPRRSMDHRIRERDRSLSPPPGRRLTRMSRSHTESRSRSRTRSPRLRPSPRGNSGASMSRGPAIRRRSRTPPVLRSEARIERPKSPLYHRVGSFEHKMSFLSPSRTQRSSPQSSKWSYARRDTDHFKSSDYRRSFIRSGSPSRRMSPRTGHDSGLSNSPGRLKHSEYRGSMYSRTSELSSESRRFKRDENENVRVKQSDVSGRSVEVGGMDIRRFRHQDDEGDCQGRGSGNKESGMSREQGMEEHDSRL